MASDPNQYIFCKIAWGVAPSFKIYEADDALAFRDINPFNEGYAWQSRKRITRTSPI